jgi:hypothetical protein
MVCSAFGSLTFKSPVKVDYLVTFIACEIVTGRELTKILGILPSRFRPDRPPAPRRCSGLAHGAPRYRLPKCRLRRLISRLTWSSQKAAA